MNYKHTRPACLGEFIRYASLNVLGMLGLSGYILADTFFIARGLGANGLAALNLAIPIYSFIHGSGLMLGMGGATKYSIYKGQGEGEPAGRLFTDTVYAALLLAAVFVTAGIFFSGNLTSLLGAKGDVYDMTATYLKVILLFSPAFLMNDVLICFVRNDGAPQLSMLAMLLGSFSNIVLDYILIFPLDLGILGAVLATGIAPLISILILSRHFVKRQNHFGLKKGKPQLSVIREVILLGVPSLVTEVSSGVVIIAFNYIILRLLGNTGVAAYGVIANISLVVVAVYTGIAQGMQPVTSSAYGRGDGNTVTQVLKYALAAMLGLSAVIYAVVFFAAGPIVGVFNSENSVGLQEIAEGGMKIYFTAVPFVGANIILAMHFTATEKAFPAQVVSVLRGLIIILPMAFILSYAAGLTGVWLAFPATECMVVLLAVWLYRRNKSDIPPQQVKAGESR